MASKRSKIVVIGGGTGSFTVLSGLKSLNCDLTALVNMVDNGGSTGQLRDEYGVLPPGDVRQCLVALSQAPESLRNLFNFRFPAGSTMAGHSFGNLFLSSVEMMTDNFLEAVRMASDILNIQGQVIPATITKCQLVMETANSKIVGQKAIDETVLRVGERPKLFLEPKAKITFEAAEAVSEADLIIISPGNLYGSIIPTLLIDGVTKGIKKSKAKVLYICNLVNKPNNNFNFKVSDYVAELERFLGRGVIDFVLYNIDTPSEKILSKYVKDKEYPVIVDKDNLKRANYLAIPSRLLSHKAIIQDKNDVLMSRSLIRHDSYAVAKEVKKIIDKLLKVSEF